MAYEKLKSECYSNLSGINTKVSTYLTDKNEFLDLTNFDFTRPGSLTKRPGTANYVGATVSGRINGIYEFERLSGASYLIVAANTNVFNVTGGAFNAFRSGLANSLFDFTTFVDRMFACNGGASGFFKWDGVTAYLYSLPAGGTLASATVGTSGAMTGTYVYKYGYLNERGLLGPAQTIGHTVAATNASLIVLSGFNVPSTQYGATAIAIYRTNSDSSSFFRIAYHPLAGATFSDTNLPALESMGDYIDFTTFIPKYIEIFNNQLFMAGFSSQLSTVYFSDIGEPEGINPDFNFEVRTNDGDKITGLKSFNGGLVIFKENSFHFLSGDNPQNFVLREISDQYGCLSNRAIVTFQNYVQFLDKKGIIEWNGANIEEKSVKIEPILRSMNITAAKENACGIHNRLRNEAWFSIPCNGATFNNCTVVYDYSVDSWTKFEGFAVSSVAYARATFTAQTAFVGSYTGTVQYFSNSLYGDLGQGMTCLAKTRYHHDLGNSITKQFRRFYLDLDPVSGITTFLNVNIMADYGTSFSASRVMYQNPFQSRIDFGVPAKSCSFEVSNFGASSPVRINGYTVEYRYQRAV